MKDTPPNTYDQDQSKKRTNSKLQRRGAKRIEKEEERRERREIRSREERFVRERRRRTKDLVLAADRQSNAICNQILILHRFTYRRYEHRRVEQLALVDVS